MRSRYIPPSASQFAYLFSSNGENKKIRGGSLDNIKTFQSPVYYQKGSGFISVLSNIFRRSVPFLKSIFLPSLADYGRDVANDYSRGVPLKKAAKSNALDAVKKLGSRIINGGRKKRKRKNKRIKSKVVKSLKKCSKKIPRDIFTAPIDL